MVDSVQQKLAIIGASEFQNPLILAAKARGIETHVFAWQNGDVGETTADYFYPISIIECDAIAEKCKEIGVDGIATIASDLANITVARVARTLGLTANSVHCVECTTDKMLMNRVLVEAGCPVPKSILVASGEGLDNLELSFPCIVKPVDRSGSRGITKVNSFEDLETAVARSIDESFAKRAIIQEYVEGREFSVEYISWQGEHRFLALTEKFTTGAPGFIEKAHLEPARMTVEETASIMSVVEGALDALGVEYGASHSEVKIDSSGSVRIIEIGSRMGGDCIGSHLVQLSTGYAFVDAVIDAALGEEPPSPDFSEAHYAGVRFIFDDDDLSLYKMVLKDTPGLVKYARLAEDTDHEIVDSGSRYGFFIFAADDLAEIESLLPYH